MLKPLKIYYVLVALPFVLLLVGSAIFFDAITLTITRNPHPQINYTIFAIILVGGCLILLNARRLIREAYNLVDFSRALHSKTDVPLLQKKANSYRGDLSCLLQMVAASSGRSISHQEQVALENELANARARLLRRNALPQYLTGLLVGMGLLGTFIGLLATLNDISLLISSFAELDMQNASPLLVFRTMIERMKAPMSSMGIAFSASMFGLLGSIILGLMMVGLRRLQGDIFSLLSSEVSRHIEIALSYESVTFRSGGEVSGDVGDVARVLIRIEERLAEAARTNQRVLAAEMEDFQKQRAEMLRVLTEQTEASNGFRSDLQQLGRQLGTLVSSLERGHRETSEQVSDLTVQMAANAKETHKLLASQVEEQKSLRDAVGSFKLEERLAEAARMQQRTLSSLIEDFQTQRSEMQRTLSEQTEASNGFRSELQQLGRQLESLTGAMAQGAGEISAQISELTVHAGADAKEAQRLIANAANTFRSEIQQLGRQLGTTLEQNSQEAAARMTGLMDRVANAFGELQEVVGRASHELKGEIGKQGGTLTQGTREVDARITLLMEQLAASSRESREAVGLASDNLRGEMRQVGLMVGKGDEEMTTQITDLKERMAALSRESNTLLSSASSSFCSELQQLGQQIATVLEKGREETCPQVSDLLRQMATVAREAEATDSCLEQDLLERQEQAAGDRE